MKVTIKLPRMDLETILEHEYQTTFKHAFDDFGYSFYYDNKIYYWDSKKKKFVFDRKNKEIFYYVVKDNKAIEVYSLAATLDEPNIEEVKERLAHLNQTAIDSYFSGESFYFRVEQHKQDKIDRQKREELKKHQEQEQQKAYENNMNEVVENLKSGKDFEIKDGGIIVDIAKKYDIYVHPQSKKTIRERVWDIKIEKGKVASYTHNKKTKVNAFKVINEIFSSVENISEVSEEELNHLFGKGSES